MFTNPNPDVRLLTKQEFLKLFLQIYSLPKYSQYIGKATGDNISKNIQQLKNKISQLQNRLGITDNQQQEPFSCDTYLKKQIALKEKLVQKIQQIYPNLLSFSIVDQIFKNLDRQHGKQCEQLMADIIKHSNQVSMRKHVEQIIRSKFDSYDEDGTGQIDIHQLQRKIKKLGLPDLIAKGIMQNADQQNDGLISFSQFKNYTEKQIMKYYKIFFTLDSDNDNKLNKQQAKHSIYQIYPNINVEDVFDKLFQTMDQDKSGYINFEEWCDFLIIFPQKNLNMMINQWAMIASTMISPQQSSSFINKDLIQGNKVKDGKKIFGPWDIVRTLIFGGISGAISRTITAPLQRVKVLYQTMYQDTKCPSIMKGLKQTYIKHGMQALFRGNTISVFLNCLEQALRFSIIQYSKKKYEIHGNNIHPHEFLFIGIITGISSSFILFPFEVLRIRFIADNYIQKVFQQAKIIYSQSGIKGFYSGLTPYLMSVLPAGSFNVMSYNILRKFFVKQNDGKEPNIQKFMFIGGAASLITNTVTYPLSLITSRLIMANKDIVAFKDKFRTHQMVKSIFQHEGLAGFYKGYVASTLRVVIGQSVNFGTYQTLKLIWMKKNQHFNPRSKAF